ncbi:unnamed protein product [Mytilus edulis]|uniref:Uncharacterized protein n=1 Tax=Mytilus edulis TaxID=6550 RepID=A0A8S3PYI7_MYTED|nr:unnamed protein product [Mytilus edulis]
MIGTNEEAEIHARLLKQYKGTIEESVEDETHEAVTDNTPKTILYKRSEVSETVSGQSEIPPVYSESTVKPQVSTESTIKPPVTNQQPNQSIEEAKKDIETMLKSNVDLHDKEEYATLLLWDFAGDEEFYHTHQTFLSPDAIYLVVTKLNEADDKNAKDNIQMDSDRFRRIQKDSDIYSENIQNDSKCGYPYKTLNHENKRLLLKMKLECLNNVPKLVGVAWEEGFFFLQFFNVNDQSGKQVIVNPLTMTSCVGSHFECGIWYRSHHTSTDVIITLDRNQNLNVWDRYSTDLLHESKQSHATCVAHLDGHVATGSEHCVHIH